MINNIYLSCVILIIVSISNQKVGGRRLKSPGGFQGSGKHVDAMMGFETAPCITLEQQSLTGILGAAFNPRYMSVNSPQDTEVLEEGTSSVKRGTDTYRPFSVDEDFTSAVNEDTPAWDVDHFKSDYFTHGRMKRESAVNTTRVKRHITTPWECKSVIKWIDLGFDFFPRYIRNVECTKHKCWYDQFVCKPKSFTVKILKRKNGQCVSEKKHRPNQYGLPSELKELWIWEERAVNFCCECGAK